MLPLWSLGRLYCLSFALPCFAFSTVENKQEGAFGFPLCSAWLCFDPNCYFFSTLCSAFHICLIADYIHLLANQTAGLCGAAGLPYYPFPALKKCLLARYVQGIQPMNVICTNKPGMLFSYPPPPTHSALPTAHSQIYNRPIVYLNGPEICFSTPV